MGNHKPKPQQSLQSHFLENIYTYNNTTPIIILPGDIIFCIGWPMTSSKVQKLECELYNPNVRVCQSLSLRSTMKTQWLSEFVIDVHHEDSSLQFCNIQVGTRIDVKVQVMQVLLIVGCMSVAKLQRARIERSSKHSKSELQCFTTR